MRMSKPHTNSILSWKLRSATVTSCRHMSSRLRRLEQPIRSLPLKIVLRAIPLVISLVTLPVRFEQLHGDSTYFRFFRQARRRSAQRRRIRRCGLRLHNCWHQSRSQNHCRSRHVQGLFLSCSLVQSDSLKQFIEIRRCDPCLRSDVCTQVLSSGTPGLPTKTPAPAPTTLHELLRRTRFQSDSEIKLDCMCPARLDLPKKKEHLRKRNFRHTWVSSRHQVRAP